MFTIGSYFLSEIHVAEQREVRQREEEGSCPGLALLAGAHTDIWLEREDLGTSMLLCPGKMFRQGN
jgi:hypothetical protein